MPEKCAKRWQSECPYRASKLGCFMVEHHMAYPSTKYKDELESEYRELPSNKVKMCRYVENELHKAMPEGPPVPSVQIMQYCVEREMDKRRLANERPNI
jgi:hypothetical protein